MASFSLGLSTVRRTTSVQSFCVMRSGGHRHVLPGESFMHLNRIANRAYHTYAGPNRFTGYIQPRNLCDINSYRNACHAKGLDWKPWWNQVFDGNPMYDCEAEYDSHLEILVNPNTRFDQANTRAKTVYSKLFWTSFELAQMLPNSVRPGFTTVSGADLIEAVKEHKALIVSVKNMALPTSKYGPRSHHTFTVVGVDGEYLLSIDGDETTMLAQKIAQVAAERNISLPDLPPEDIQRLSETEGGLIRRDRADVVAAKICRPIITPGD